MTAWKTLEEREILSDDMLKTIDRQIQGVAANTYRLFRS
jgi:hypothetical protein